MILLYITFISYLSCGLEGTQTLNLPYRCAVILLQAHTSPQTPGRRNLLTYVNLSQETCLVGTSADQAECFLKRRMDLHHRPPAYEASKLLLLYSALYKDYPLEPLSIPLTDLLEQLIPAAEPSLTPLRTVVTW